MSSRHLLCADRSGSGDQKNYIKQYNTKWKRHGELIEMLLLISPFTFYYFYNLEIRTIICKWRLIHLKLFYCRLYFTAFTTVSIRIYYLYLYLCWTRRLIYNIVLYVRQYFLEANGIPLSQIIYVNFEDERLLEMTAEDLNLILEIGLEIS